MCCDESNAQPSKNVDFFVYGGLAISADKVGALSDDIGKIRREFGFNAESSLKFQSASRPSDLAHETWTLAKAATIDACVSHGAELIAVTIHHKIAESNKAHMTEWQLNTCLVEFNRRLEARSDHGMVIIDRIPDRREYSILRDKFRLGGATPWGGSNMFDRVVSYSSTSDGASHLASATDVVVGSLAFCMNQRHGGAGRCRVLYRSIEPMMWDQDDSSRSGPLPRGLIFSPAQVKSLKYSLQYDELRKHLAQLSAT